MVDQQSIPERARCPECGGDPVDPSHTLSALGYKHDDQQLQCIDCRNKWTCGVPVGELDEYYWHDLVCQSCSEMGRVHRIRPGDGVIGLHMKCPECYYVWKVSRIIGEKNISIVGWPMTTGEMGDGHAWSIDGEIVPSNVDVPLGDRGRPEDVPVETEKHVKESVSVTVNA